jgi:hypothetical protein
MPDEPTPEGWARQLRLDAAAVARSRRAHWDRLGAEEATLRSTIEALARAGHDLDLHLGPGGSHRGAVTELGPDHVRLAVHDRWRYLRLSSVEVITDAGGAAGAGGAAPPALVERTFEDVLSRLDGRAVTLVLASGAQRVGRLAAVGVDVLTLSGSLPAEPTYVSSSAVVAVLGDGSG